MKVHFNKHWRHSFGHSVSAIIGEWYEIESVGGKEGRKCGKGCHDVDLPKECLIGRLKFGIKLVDLGVCCYHCHRGLIKN
eukprot:7800684-Ditylum_brightwellii.AAC.1